MNIVLVSGRLGADPRITNFENGGKSAQFNLAVTERAYKRQDGTEVPERTEWLSIETSKSGIAGVVEKYLKKGSFVTIEGRLKNRNWEKDGVKHFATAIAIENLELCPRNNGGQNEIPSPVPDGEVPKTDNSGSRNNTPSDAPPPAPAQDKQDDLPF